jgi:hypothetical protein
LLNLLSFFIKVGRTLRRQLKVARGASSIGAAMTPSAGSRERRGASSSSSWERARTDLTISTIGERGVSFLIMRRKWPHCCCFSLGRDSAASKSD